MSRKAVSLVVFGLAIGLVGFLLPVALLSRWQTSLRIEQSALARPVEGAIASNTAQESTAAAPHLKVDLSDRQVVLYQGETKVKSYPVAIGRSGWETPTGTFRITQMMRNPRWIQPITDEVIPPDDPRNPLGGYWIGFWTDGRNWVGFHGTSDPNSVGSAVSHGCIRMYNPDIEELFRSVSPGTLVTVSQ